VNVCFDAEIVGPWVSSKTNGDWCKGRGTAIGKVSGDKLVAGVLYEDFTGSNVVCHIAGEGQWASRDFLWLIFDYPFNQLKVKRITCPVGSTNAKCIGLMEAMGFTIEANLSQAIPDGDLFLFRMFRDECKYLKDRYGKTLNPPSA
jgi:RimJ/RimL family protein N-acetyltransferase